MPVLELSGSPKERGQFYGDVFKFEIGETIKLWLNDLGNYGRDGDISSNKNIKRYLESFFSETSYLSSIQQWAPNLLEEINGIAEAVEQPREYILGLSLIDEEWIFGLHHRLNKPTEKCTGFGLPVHAGQAGRAGFAGQNMDIGSWVDGKQVLLRLAESSASPEALVFSIAGCIGLNGLNASGIGVTCNTLSQLQHAVDGLPVIFIIRKLLEKTSVDEAEIFLRTIKHASGQNYIVSSANEVRCFECSAYGVNAYVSDNEYGRVFHTNHPLTKSQTCNNQFEVSDSSSSTERLKSINNRLGAKEDISLADIKAALAAHDNPIYPVSRDFNPDKSSIGFTAGASIYEFGDSPKLHIASGPPCKTRFEVFNFSNSDASSIACKG